MKHYDVIVIGAGPGGIFATYELIKKQPNLSIAVFEAGHKLSGRKCPIDGDKIPNCINCKSCSIMSGFGGAGAFSDGKYNITNDFGGTLYEHIGKKQAIELMKYVDEINMEHGGEGTRLFSTAGTKFKKICMQNKLKLLDASAVFCNNADRLCNIHRRTAAECYEKVCAGSKIALGCFFYCRHRRIRLNICENIGCDACRFQAVRCFVHNAHFFQGRTGKNHRMGSAHLLGTLRQFGKRSCSDNNILWNRKFE